ncbi:MAG TPA: SDR family oxidoreductase [Candidatus Competibacteraceae bacterium]|nr:SDR family oxidoreductase [Candidatus Competibacteraceae bacterium]MCP5133306.1 SDR family oxidoreductase [Gammaproteobacteria bacterium]HPF57281.1 SDR family oxidoreductase [Candidatus Competibacteraceae bacterium]HRY17904.1 SDR family oxidoreductase [Candidatus Competibacteraceae bacterium]
MHNLNGKTAIITGASRGIGASIAKALATAGARVVVNYAQNQIAAHHVISAIQAEGGEAIAYQADVSQAIEVKALFDTAIQHFGDVHILVNNAAIMTNHALVDTTDADFDQTFAINVRGVFNMLRESAHRLANNGRIINLSTTVTRLLLPHYGAYAASKGAVEQLSRVFAKEIGSRGITVNVVSPGPTHTELFTHGKSEETIQRLAAMSAFGRIAEPEDIAQVVVFLASDEAAWITGQNIGANGGFA